MKAFVMDLNKCSGCYACQFACKDEHCGNDWTPYAKPQPETGQFWGKMIEYVRGQVPQVKMAYVFMPCQHCENAPCVKACPVQGALYTRDDGLVIIDPKKCTGCRSCVSACPYGAIYFNPQIGIAQKCTGCAHLVDKKVVYAPRCADSCPYQALKFGEEQELAAEIAQSETLHPEFGVKTRVHYIGLPKRFIAGTVYDPAAKEVVIGATVTVSGDSNATATTNNFGDFWIEGLKVGTFTLKIEKADKTKTIADIKTDQDVSLGDIALG